MAPCVALPYCPCATGGARSLWHGPDKDGRMEVEILPGQQQQLPTGHIWQRQQQVAALQAPDLATELQVGH